jgi:beta-galactosidase/beta-glucuronidase
MIMVDMFYPRPQFIRRDWQSLDGSWQYAFDETDLPFSVQWQGGICVPFPPESPQSGIHDTSYHPVIWYRRTFQVPVEWRTQRLVLHFGAVDYLAQVWINGQLVAEHEGGHTPFSVDITPALVPGEQELVVRAADDPHDLEKPRGKQDWQPEPHSIWYPRTSGIWQPVWLEPVPTISIRRLRLTPDVPNLTLLVEAQIAGPAANDLSVDLRLSLHENLLAEASIPVAAGRISGALALPQPDNPADRKALLWCPENPVLFDLSVTLRRGDTVVDQVESYAGLRSVEARDGQFYLNGQPYFLQMVLDQGYWSESLLAAPSPEALRRDVELTKALGFNGARKHQKIEDPRYLYWADRLGLVVWDELPSAYTFSAQTSRRLTSEFIAMIERDYNHPCVVAWVPLNESWGIPDVGSAEPQRQLAQALYFLGKSLDPTRLVIDNDGWEHTRTDLLTIHDYNNQPEVFHRRYNTLDCLSDELDHQKKILVDGFCHQNLPIILSEFGGIKMGNGGGWGYQKVNTAEEFLERFAPLMRTVYGKTLSGYCYTQLTDTFQEENGLLTMDRQPKVPIEVVSSILREGLSTRLLRSLS